MTKIDSTYLFARPTTSSSTAQSSKLFKEWSSTYKNLKFYAGETKFGKGGVGNMTISPDKLREMERDPKAKAEFEKVLKDCNEVAREMKDKGTAKLKSQGFVFDAEGGLTGWSIASDSYTESNQRYTVVLDLEKPSGWFMAMNQNLTIQGYTNWQKKFSDT